jgi:MFS family permease
MMIMMSTQYLAPNLAIHLHFFGYSQEQIGLAYGIPAILYATSCPFMFMLTERMKKRGIILIGFIQITFAMLMIGGSDSFFEF